MRATLTEGGLPVAATTPLDGTTAQVAILETVNGPKPLGGDPALQKLAIGAWRIFALTGYATIHVHLDDAQRPAIVSVHANPSLAASAAFVTAAGAAGLSQTDVVENLLAAAQA